MPERMRDRIWEGLSAGKAAGRVCVICSRDYLVDRRSPARRVVVGRAGGTGSPVFACVGACANQAVVRCYRGGAMALSGRALAQAVTAVHGHAARELTSPADPLRVGEVVCEVVAAAAPLLIAAELRWLAGVFEDDAQVVWSQATREACRDCARLAREHAFGMDPAGGRS